MFTLLSNFILKHLSIRTSSPRILGMCRNQSKSMVYLVYAPELVEWSAGIKVLYKLFEAIAASGRHVLLINHGRSTLRYKIHIMRELMKLNRRYHQSTFVAFYTESIIGNPLRVNTRIRWILNYPGLLGGSESFPDDIILSYTQNIARRFNEGDEMRSRVLFIPALNSSEIQNLVPALRWGDSKPYNLVYAQKYRSLGGKPNFTGFSTKEISRFEKKSPNRAETLELIRNAQSLHVFENTTVITEAQLCGVPVFCHRNEFFDELIAEKELGDEGTTWDLTLEPATNPDIVRSRLLHFESSYRSQIESLLNQIEAELEVGSPEPSRVHFNPFTSPLKHRIRRFIALAKRQHWRTAVRFLSNHLRRSVRRRTVSRGN